MQYILALIGIIIILAIAISIISWAFKNIVGLLGFAVAAWGVYEWNKNTKLGAKSKVPAIIVAAGLIVGSGWFAFSPDSQPSSPPVATESQQTDQQANIPSSSSSETSNINDTPTSNLEDEKTPSPVNLVSAKILSITDGDTIEASIEGKTEKVRLIGVDTPETKHPSQPVEAYGPEASNYTKSQLSGKTVYLEKDVEERDKYGRLLAYLWLAKPSEVNDSEIREKLFNSRLILDGYAQLMTIPPNVKYVDYFTEYQTEAREGSKGLWAVSSAPAQSTPSNNSPSPSATSTINNEVFVGSANSDKYHYPDCRWAKKINPGNLVEFSSPEDAKNSGYVACKVCSPP